MRDASIREIVETTMRNRSNFACASYLPDALDRICEGMAQSYYTDPHILETLERRLHDEEMRAFKAAQPTRRGWKHGRV